MCLTCVNCKAVNLAHSSPFSWLFFMFYFFSISIPLFIYSQSRLALANF